MSNSTITPTSSFTSSFSSSSSSLFTSSSLSTPDTSSTSTPPPTSTSTPPSTSSTPATTSTPSTSSRASITTFTSVSTVSSSGLPPTVVTVTSTASAVQPSSSDSASKVSSSSSTSTSASSGAALATSTTNSGGSSGLSSSGKIAIAVVVPIVGIAAIVVGLLFLWKRHKARKTAEEERRKEVEEYGYNPNNDPTLPAVGSNYGENHSEMQEDHSSGYRGWGNTSTTRKASTTLGSNRGAVGMAVSDTTSNGGYTGPHSEGTPGEAVSTPGHERSDSETIGALGSAPVAGTQNRDINRGPSNASSAYTNQKSDVSDEGDRSPNAAYAPQYYDEGNLYSEAQPRHGPYGDGTYGSAQPVIRDVQARRNTRIEKPSVFPQQGNAGISQNF